MPYVTHGNCSLSNSVHTDQQNFGKQRTQQAEEVREVMGLFVGIRAYDGLLMGELTSKYFLFCFYVNVI